MQDDTESGRCKDGMVENEPSPLSIRSLMELQPLNPYIPLEFSVLSIRPTEGRAALE